MACASAPASPGGQANAAPPACDSGFQPPASAAAPSTPIPTFTKSQVMIRTAQGVAVPLRVDVADTEVKREFGLMYRTSMPADCGMIFVFQPAADAKQIAFWMKDTLIPLYIAFVLPDSTIE